MDTGTAHVRTQYVYKTRIKAVQHLACVVVVLVLVCVEF